MRDSGLNKIEQSSFVQAVLQVDEGVERRRLTAGAVGVSVVSGPQKCCGVRLPGVPFHRGIELWVVREVTGGEGRCQSSLGDRFPRSARRAVMGTGNERGNRRPQLAIGKEGNEL